MGWAGAFVLVLLLAIWGHFSVFSAVARSKRVLTSSVCNKRVHSDSLKGLAGIHWKISESRAEVSLSLCFVQTRPSET